jgi:hypothetical protein
MRNAIFTGLVILLFISFSSAQFGIPNQFWGSVVDSVGTKCPDGTLIIAKISDKDVAATSCKNGNYGLDGSVFYVSDPFTNRQGKLIEFFILDLNSGEHVFVNGATNELNLVYPGTFPVPAQISSGGGGGSSRLSSNNNNNTNVTSVSNSCVEEWQCSEWLDCINNNQKRVCSDLNNCGSINNRPEQTRDCESIVEDGRVVEEYSLINKIMNFFGLTGRVIDSDGNQRSSLSWFAVLVMLFLIIVIVAIIKKYFIRR